MKKVFTIMLLIVLGLALLPTVTSGTTGYNILDKTETFTATQDVATAEEVTLAETPEEIEVVYINGAEATLTTDYTVSGSVITFAVDSTVADDVITVDYTFESDAGGTAVDALVQLLPILFVVGLVGGVIVYVKFKG